MYSAISTYHMWVSFSGQTLGLNWDGTGCWLGRVGIVMAKVLWKILPWVVWHSHVTESTRFATQTPTRMGRMVEGTVGWGGRWGKGDGGICWQPIRPMPSNRALTFVPVHFMHNQRFDLMEKMNFTPRSAVFGAFCVAQKTDGKRISMNVKIGWQLGKAFNELFFPLPIGWVEILSHNKSKFEIVIEASFASGWQKKVSENFQQICGGQFSVISPTKMVNKPNKTS